jgi:hypothetical protein
MGIDRHLEPTSGGGRLAAAGLVLGLISAVLALVPASGAGAQTSGEFTLAAVHPAARTQPTELGQVLTELRVHDGTVWAGYGDYEANTGPIALSAFDPAAPAQGFQQAFLSDTEAIYNLREVNGQLVAPATDPRSSSDFAIDGPWRDQQPFGATHVFDTVSLDGNDLWMVGSQNIDAVAWRSVDGGTSWTEALRIAPRRGNDFARFYFTGVIDGSLVVQARDAMGGPHRSAMGFDGVAWSERPTMLLDDDRGWRTDAYGAGLVYHSSGHARQGAARHYDGTATTTLHPDAYDVEVTASHVWILTATGAVIRSSDLAAWDTVAQAPATARSLAVTGETLYVGTTASELWTMTIAPQSDTTDATTVDDTTSTIDDTTTVGDTTSTIDDTTTVGDTTSTIDDTTAVDDTTDTVDATTTVNPGTERCPKGWQKKGRC